MGLSTDIASHIKSFNWLQRSTLQPLTRPESITAEKRLTIFEFAVLFSTLIQGMNNVVTKLILVHFHPWVYFMLATGLAVLVGWLLLWIQERQIRYLLQDWKPFFFPGVLGRALSGICWSLGLTYTSASTAALISCSTPIFTTVYMVFTRQEPMTGRGWAGIILSVSGVYLVITKGKGIDLHIQSFFGNMLILLGALLWSYYLIMVKKWMSEKRYSVLQVNVLSMTNGLTLLIPFGASQFYQQDWQNISPLTWSLVVYTVLVGMVLSALLWTWGVKGIGLNRTVIYQYLTPVIAVVGAWIVLGEPLTIPKTLGGVLVLGGIYLARRR